MTEVRIISSVGDTKGILFNAMKLDENGKTILFSDCIVKFYAVNFSWERDKK